MTKIKQIVARLDAEHEDLCERIELSFAALLIDAEWAVSHPGSVATDWSHLGHAVDEFNGRG